MKAAVVLAGAALLAMPLSCAAEIPVHSSHYNNSKYEFSMNIPDHLRGCISENTDDGVEIALDRHSGCEHVTDRPPMRRSTAATMSPQGSRAPKGLRVWIAVVPR